MLCQAARHGIAKQACAHADVVLPRPLVSRLVAQMESKALLLYTTAALQSDDLTQTIEFSRRANASADRLLEQESRIMLGVSELGRFLGTMEAPDDIVSVVRLHAHARTHTQAQTHTHAGSFLPARLRPTTLTHMLIFSPQPAPDVVDLCTHVWHRHCACCRRSASFLKTDARDRRICRRARLSTTARWCTVSTVRCRCTRRWRWSCCRCARRRLQR
jgi:hypothetical protein